MYMRKSTKLKTKRGPQTVFSRTNSRSDLSDQLTYRPTNRSLHENRQSKSVSGKQPKRQTAVIRVQAKQGKQPTNRAREHTHTHTHTRVNGKHTQTNKPSER